MARRLGAGIGRETGSEGVERASGPGPETRRRAWHRNVPLGLLALLWILPVPAAALSILPGQSFEVDFSMTAPAPTADVLAFSVGTTLSSGVTSVTYALYDGATLLASRTGGTADLMGFVESGSAWTLNAVVADLSSLQAGTIAGRIVATPNFDGSPGAVLDASFLPATGLVIGQADGPSSVVPLPGGSFSVGQPFIVPEPGSLALLAAASLLGAARSRAT